MTEKSEKENQDGQYYTFIKMTDLSEEQFRDGVVKTWDVHCCSCLNYNNPPPQCIMVDKDGVLYCSYKKDVDWARPDKHINCVLGGDFSEK